MFIKSLAILIAAAAMTVWVAPVQAQANREEAQNLCEKHGSDPRERIRGCTWLLQSDEKKESTVSFYYWLRALAYMDLKEFDKAEPDADRAIELWGGHPKSMTRGLIRASRGNYSGAIDDFTVATEYVREDSDRDERSRSKLAFALLMRAKAKFDSGKFAWAYVDLDEVIKLEPANRQAYLLRSRVRAAMGDHAGAEEDRIAGRDGPPAAGSQQ
jgi:tetratricopeptide (TPR) repeat protein